MRSSRDSSRVLAALPAALDAAVVCDGDTTVIAAGTEEVVRVDGPAVFDTLDALRPGFWAGLLAYDLGRDVERVTARAGPAPARAVPDGLFARFAARVELQVGCEPRLHGTGTARRALARAVEVAAGAGRRPGRPALSGWTSSLDRDGYEARVRTLLEHIRAGDCYQANLTRRLSTPAVTDGVGLWDAIVAGNPAPHAVFLRVGELTLVSASPERFLRLDGPLVETRPIKGTARERAVLRASTKDRAENVMIVDLARNDLGRVCAPGSIHVPQLCALEDHPGLTHLVSTVRGRLRAGVGIGGLVRATFPPASITGAPKPRVLQLIEDLEPVPRGAYCGALGWVDTERGRADLAVAIRTFTMTPAGATFGVGAGITADSDPGAEWAETELKAARLLALAGGRALAPHPCAPAAVA